MSDKLEELWFSHSRDAVRCRRVAEVWLHSEKKVHRQVTPVNKFASRWRKEPELTWSLDHFLNGTRRSSEDASGTYNTSTREAQQALERKRKCRRVQNLPAHGHYYMPAVGPVKRHVHHLRATCDAREPVCLHENTPGELAPLKLIRPGGFVSIWAKRWKHFPWNGAELWLALVHARRSAREICHRNPLNQGRKISCLIARPRHVIQISKRDPLSWHCSVGLQERCPDLVELGKAYYA